MESVTTMDLELGELGVGHSDHLIPENCQLGSSWFSSSFFLFFIVLFLSFVIQVALYVHFLESFHDV